MSDECFTQASSLSQSLWRFSYSSSVHSCYLFLISSASVRSLTFVSFIVPLVASILLSNLYFLQFYYFPLILAVFTYEDFLIFPCYSPELCIPLCISFLFSFAFHFSYFLSCFFLFVCFLNVELYLFFFFFSKFYLILFFNFTILYWVCHISKWIHHRYICVPHPEPSSLLPPHTIPLYLKEI